MKITTKFLVIVLIALTASMSLTTYTTSKAYAYGNGSIRLHEIAKPPAIKLGSSFNPASVYGTATTTPVGGAPFCYTTYTVLCYPPAFLKKAYDFPTTLTGAGQTIVILDAFGSPTIARDLRDFDGNFSIPAPPSFKILCGPTWTGAASDHCPTPLPTDPNVNDEEGWSAEITLDVTQAHALAPGANIVLVVSNSDYDSDLNAARLAVVQQPSLAGSIMSQTFYEPDDLVGCNYLPCNNTTPGVFDPTIRSTYDNTVNIATTNMWTVLAISGDAGASNAYPVVGTGELTPSWPATNPNTLAVGGTQGQPYGGQYGTSNPENVYPPTGTLTCAAGATCNTGLVVMSGGTNGCTGANVPMPTGCKPTGYGGEGAWQEYNIIGPDSTGGGISTNYYLNSETAGNFTFMNTYAPPSYQAGLPTSFALTNATTTTGGTCIDQVQAWTGPCTRVSRTGRITPDVAFNSAVYGGVLAYFSPASEVGSCWSVPCGAGWWVFGGTSASSPAWAAIMALVNQAHGSPVGFINPAIYNLASSGLYNNAFHDIKVGNNTAAPGITQNGYVAGPGYDPTTGWGTPDVANFVNDIQFFITAAGASSYPISLVQGWNLISMPVVPQNTAIKTVLGALITANDFTSITSYQGGKWVSATLSAGKLSGPLTTVQDGYGYWIYMTQPATLTVNGYVIAPPPSLPPRYSLAAGWNLVGFKPEPTVTSETVGAYLTSLGTSYDPNNVWVYDNTSGSWMQGTSTTLTPGEAMWILMTSPTTLSP
jgi:subtilase family serine protease